MQSYMLASALVAANDDLETLTEENRLLRARAEEAEAKVAKYVPVPRTPGFVGMQANSVFLPRRVGYEDQWVTQAGHRVYSCRA